MVVSDCREARLIERFASQMMLKRHPRFLYLISKENMRGFFGRVFVLCQATCTYSICARSETTCMALCQLDVFESVELGRIPTSEPVLSTRRKKVLISMLTTINY